MGGQGQDRQPHISHYLDDYLFVCPGGTSICVDPVAAFQELAAETSIPLAADKTEGLATNLTFLGIFLDTVQSTSSLPCEKMTILWWLISESMSKKKNACSGRFSPYWII